MSKNKNINKRVWQRFLQESPFDEMVKEFRSNNDIPLTGFENRKEASKWRKKGLNEQRYEEFCREIAGLTLNKCYSYIFDTGSMIVPILFDYVLFYPKDKMKGVFSRIDKGCHIIYPHYGSQSMGVDLPQDFPEHHRKNVLIAVSEEATHRDIIDYVSQKSVWEHIKYARENWNQDIKGIKFRSRSKSTQHAQVFQMYKSGYLYSDGRYKNLHKMPQKYQELLNLFPNIETRKSIIRNENKKKKMN